MITVSKLNPHNYPTNPEIDANLIILCDRLCHIEDAYGQELVVTSGLRSQAQQQSLIASGKSNATHSKHLTGQAVDIYDPNGELKAWIMANLLLIETIEFWFEDFSYTVNWVHFQIVPPASGNRFFIP